jgi:hypothetical protein
MLQALAFNGLHGRARALQIADAGSSVGAETQSRRGDSGAESPGSKLQRTSSMAGGSRHPGHKPDVYIKISMRRCPGGCGGNGGAQVRGTDGIAAVTTRAASTCTTGQQDWRGLGTSTSACVAVAAACENEAAAQDRGAERTPRGAAWRVCEPIRARRPTEGLCDLSSSLLSAVCLPVRSACSTQQARAIGGGSRALCHAMTAAPHRSRELPPRLPAGDGLTGVGAAMPPKPGGSTPG